MRPLSLDYRRVPASQRVGAVVLALAVVAGALLLQKYRSLAAEKDGWQEQTAQLHSSRQRAAAPGSPAARLLEPELRRANQVLGDLTLPWDALFKAIESSKVEQVSLLAIQPDAQKGSVNISAEAQNMEDILKYVRRLSQEPLLQNVHLLSHQVQHQDAQRSVQFTVIAQWKQ